MKRRKPPAPGDKKTTSKVAINSGPAPVTVSDCYFEIKQEVLDASTVRLAQTIAEALSKLVAVLPRPNQSAITIGAKEPA